MSSPTTAQERGATTSVIHDIGYRRYTGPRLGRPYPTRSLYTHSLRTAYGLGRTAAAKVFPWLVFALLVAVAAVLAAIRSQIGERVTEYWEFPGNIVLLVVLFSAVVAPELVSRDLRSGVLQLYFSRPLSRVDYPLAKWAAMITAIFLLLAGPLLLIFVAGAFTLPDMGAVWDEFLDFTTGLAVAAVMAVLFASVALLVGSISGRRAVAAVIIAAVFTLTGVVALVINALGFIGAEFTEEGGVVLTESGQQLQQLSGLASPTTLSGGVAGWLFDPTGSTVGPYGPLYLVAVIVLVGLCVLLTLLRYRKVAR
jgi:ABC-2 type transport system permease protein